jgi:hypothetical protein
MLFITKVVAFEGHLEDAEKSFRPIAIADPKQ